jgi:hypothetical protein
MIRRCTNPDSTGYARYGGRGITVCDRWRESFANFLADMGPKPTPRHTIDRINNDGNYEPGNCRWATGKEQCRNTRRNRYIEHDGRRMTQVEWCEETGMIKATLCCRLKSGWSVAAALTTPVNHPVPRDGRSA